MAIHDLYESVFAMIRRPLKANDVLLAWQRVAVIRNAKIASQSRGKPEPVCTLT